MAWKDQLRPASFRDVPFYVESDDMTVGRRVQVFEYPQRDKPYSEDLGRAAREISIPGFVIGPDYMAARDALLAALEAPGPGTLVHPWYGSLQVIAKPARVSHSQDEGGMCRFALVFVEAGDKVFPATADAPGARSASAAGDLQSASVDGFSAGFSVAGWPGFVADDALAALSSGLGELQSVAARVGGLIESPVTMIDGLVADLESLVQAPADLAGQVMGLFTGAPISSSSIAGAVGDAGNTRAVAGAVAATGSFPPPSALPSTQVSPARRRMHQNREAVQGLLRQALLVQSTSIVASMPLPVYEDAVALRADLCAALDAESLVADDAMYQVLQQARTAVHQDIGSRLDEAVRLVSVTPPEPMPALVLAYDLYEDAGRDAEIAARNRVPHPGFVPAEPIKVLSL